MGRLKRVGGGERLKEKWREFSILVVDDCVWGDVIQVTGSVRSNKRLKSLKNY